MTEISIDHKERNELIDKVSKTCERCWCVKPPRAHHCSVCGRCVMKMDHHCPWMNNCIGIFNQKAFLLFNFYTIIVCFYTFIRAVVEGIICGTSKCYTYTNGGYIAGAVIIGLTAVASFIFTLVMLCESVTMIRDQTSTIDRKIHSK